MQSQQPLERIRGPEEKQSKERPRQGLLGESLLGQEVPRAGQQRGCRGRLACQEPTAMELPSAIQMGRYSYGTTPYGLSLCQPKIHGTDTLDEVPYLLGPKEQTSSKLLAPRRLLKFAEPESLQPLRPLSSRVGTS